MERIKNLQKLLELEKKVAVEECEQLLKSLDAKSAQKRGLSLLNMRVSGIRSGLGGKQLIDFEFEYATQNPVQEAAFQSFRSGDIVGVLPNGGQQQVNGVVFKVADLVLTVSFSQDSLDDDWGNDLYRINKLANEVQFERLNASLKNVIASIESSSASPLTAVILGSKKPDFDIGRNADISYQSQSLNDSQKDAVAFALDARQLALILGPPGTGKTTTIVEIIQQMLMINQRILVCAPSNVAVDNILERLPPKKGYRMVRIGHPARVLPQVLDYTLDLQLNRSDGGKIVADIRREIDQLLSKVSKAKSRSERKEYYAQIKDLKKDLRKREPKALKELLKNTQAIFTTLSSAGSKIMRDERFDVIIIDEISQSTEPECWIGLLKAQKAILVGDPYQLPPTILSDDASKGGLQVNLFTTLTELHGSSIHRLLNKQYRMHPTIMKWTNDFVYNSKLSGFPDEDWLLHQLPGVQLSDDTIHPLVFYDTAGFDYFESFDQDGDGFDLSRWNEQEADLCALHVKQLISSGLSADQIAVISPYAAQGRLIKEKLSSSIINGGRIEVGTVDGFQGREKEAIVVSLVRSNDNRQVGFLADMRRLNVALTRARRHLCVICDSETVSNDKFMEKMVEFMMEHADIRYPIN